MYADVKHVKQATQKDDQKSKQNALQWILDSTGDALISCDLDGFVCEEISRAAVEWFGKLPDERMTVWDYLFANDVKTRERFALGFFELSNDVIVFELAAAQMPKRWQHRGWTFDFNYKQVCVDGVVERILIVIQDATERVQAEQAEKEAREMQAIVEQLLKDRDGFVVFRMSVEEIFAELREICAQQEEIGAAQSITKAARPLHTLKGNTAIFGLATLAQACHRLEDKLAEKGSAFIMSDIDDIYKIWRNRINRISALIDVEATKDIRIESSEYEAFIEKLKKSGAHADVVWLAEQWAQPSAKAILTRLSQSALLIARSIGRRIETKIQIEENALHVPVKDTDAFWNNLIHVVRNAVDHGIKVPHERVASGKKPVGKIIFRAWLEYPYYCVAIDDDGTGIHWEHVRLAAQKRNLPSLTQEDLENALFADGLSTREHVSALSGRGIGTSAVASAVRALGGSWRVFSTLGQGTSFVFYLPFQQTANDVVSPDVVSPSAQAHAA